MGGNRTSRGQTGHSYPGQHKHHRHRSHRIWISHCEAEGLEFGTIKQRREHLNLHIGHLFGREKFSSLTTPRIHQFDAELRTAGRSLRCAARFSLT